MSKIRLEEGDFNFCFVVRRVSRIKEEREDSLYIQTDWEYPGVASSFGWTVDCECSTDGTVACQHKTVSEHLASAYDFLTNNIGKVVDAPTKALDLTNFIDEQRRLPRLTDRPRPWHYRGWLLPYVILLHEHCPAVADRWGYHLRTLQARQLLNEPIPPIAFGQPDNKVFALLRDWSRLIGKDCGGWSDFHTLLDWLCWGLALSNEEPRLSDDVNEKLYRQVNLGPLLGKPFDYLGEHVATSKATAL